MPCLLHYPKPLALRLRNVSKSRWRRMQQVRSAHSCKCWVIFTSPLYCDQLSFFMAWPFFLFIFFPPRRHKLLVFSIFDQRISLPSVFPLEPVKEVKQEKMELSEWSFTMPHKESYHNRLEPAGWPCCRGLLSLFVQCHYVMFYCFLNVILKKRVFTDVHSMQVWWTLCSFFFFFCMLKYFK